MGILNCTPDSFYDGGKYESVQALTERALQMAEEGADWIDIGGESTRPGSHSVSLTEEVKRVIPVVCAIRRVSNIPLSIDTTKALVALKTLEAGANMINDVSGLTADPEMIDVALHYQCPVILMHRRGNPETMQSLAVYQNVVEEVSGELQILCEQALQKGIKKKNILVDPGFGFAKNVDQNWTLLSRLDEFKKPGFPLVVGVSRKSFIGQVLNQDKPAERLHGSLICAFWASLHGANILRVHDVGATKDVIKIFQAIDKKQFNKLCS